MAATNGAEVVESGKRLATFPRRGGRDRPEGELRINLDSYEGHPFVSLRLWEVVKGRWLPTKKGMSVRLSEAPGVIEALQRAIEEAKDEVPRGQGQATKYREWQAPEHPRRPYSGKPEDRPLIDESKGGFDEFGNGGGR